MIGIDLAKSVFQIHAVDQRGQMVFRKTLKRDEMISFFANFPITKIAMEACGSSQYWGRVLRDMGHEIKIISAQYVKPYKRTRQKNDQVDAEAIAEAAMRPNMRFVSVKNLMQQDIQSLHRVRQLLLESRVQFTNQIRGLFAEYGVVMSKSVTKFFTELPDVLEDAENGLTSVIREIARKQWELIKLLEDEKDNVEEKIKSQVSENEDCQRLLKIPGIGPMGASMFLAKLGDPNIFKNGRHVSAWLGLVPRQKSSGGSSRLQGITKTGDSKLRSVIIHGARSVVLSTIKKQGSDTYSKWILQLYKKKG